MFTKIYIDELFYVDIKRKQYINNCNSTLFKGKYLENKHIWCLYHRLVCVGSNKIWAYLIMHLMSVYFW